MLRLDGHARRAQTESSANGGDQAADDRMQMEMLVRVAMIEGQAGGAKRLELRGDFRRDLGSRLAANGDNGPERRHIGAKRAVDVDQMA